MPIEFMYNTDPCQKYGCALQNCLFQQLNTRKDNTIVHKDAQNVCTQQYIELELCRRNNNLTPQESMNIFFYPDSNTLLPQYYAYICDKTLLPYPYPQ